MSYQVRDVYITMIFIEVIGVCCNNFFFSGPKVTAVFVSELPGSWRIYYHAFYREVIGVCYNNSFFHLVKKLPQCLCVSYQIRGV